MATKIIHKKSSTPSSVPAAGDLEPGELALNLADQKIYSKTTGGTVVEMGGGTPSAEALLTSIKTVDGSGSGLDADLLDGQQGSYYAPKTIGVYYVTGTGTVAGTWTGSNSDIDSYYEGLVVKFKINIAGASTTTLNINGLGAKTVYLYGTSKLTTHYPVGTVLDLTYTNDNGGSFYATMWYDTTDDYRIRWQNNITAGAYIHGYQLLLEGMDGKFYPVTEGGANSTTNTVSTAAFKPQGAMLYYDTSTDIAANAQGGAYYLYESLYTGTMEYWSNRSTTAWATTGLPVYLVGSINSSGAFILDNSTTTSFLTQDLPTSADGKVYMQVGVMNNTTDAIRLAVNHPLFEYRDGAVRPYAYLQDHNHDDRYYTESEINTKLTDGSVTKFDPASTDTFTGTYPVLWHDNNITPYTSTWFTINGATDTLNVPNINLSGNVTVGGTVDGRDVAVDGTKLDGIEANATADQTAAEILTAIKTVDGSGSGLDADLLDGQHASSFASSSHSHSFDSLTSKTSGTGEYSTSGALVSGRGSGGVALTVNDGYGNANVTFNHKSGVPEQTGNAGRIEVNTDGTTNASMNIELGTNLTGGTASGLTTAANFSDTAQTLYYSGAQKFVTTSSGVSVTGDIAVSGTVDGRDVAADGTKLDGIESGATADQTAAEILTAIKTVDGAGSGLDADTLDGIQASSFLQGNQTITLSGDLTGSGTTSINAQLAANVVGAAELNVTGNGTTSQYLRSDGDGSFTWATPTDTNTTYSAGNGITLTGTTFSVAAGTGLTQDAGGLSVTANGISATQLNVTGNGTTAQYLRSDGDGSFTWATPTDTNTTYSAGSGISLSGTTFSHSDTSSQPSVNNSNGLVIQDVSLDTYGHVTGLISADLDGRYYTESESDNRYARRYESSATIADTTNYTQVAKVTGDRLGSAIRLAINGTGNNVVINVVADIIVNHSGDILIQAISGNYTQCYIQVVSDGNENYDIRLRGTGAVANTVVSLDIFTMNDEIVTFTSSTTYSTTTLTHLTYPGSSLSASDSGAGDLRVDDLMYVNTSQRVFADDYHPNADKWTTARTNTVTLTGNVTGSGSATVDGSGNWTVNISTTNTDKGSSQNIFKNIEATDTDSGYTWAETGTVVADNNNDTVKFVSGDGIDIDADAANDALRISSTVPFYSVVNTGTVAGTWTGSHNGISSYTDGLIIAFYPNNVAGASTTTLNINNLGAKTIYYYGTSKLTTHYHQKSLILLRYCSDDDCFRVHSNYDSTEDYNVRWENDITVNNSASTGVAVHGYQLLMEGADGKFYPVTEGGAASTTNAVSTAEFRVGGTILFYNAGTDYNANAILTSDSLYTSEYATSMEYWINRTAAWATAYRPVYLVATLNSNGNFVLDNTSYTSFLTQNLPTSDDGKFYIKIGWMQNTYDAIRIQTEHPVYVYKGGRVREYGGYAGISDKWTTARTLSLTGAVTGSASIDGSGNVSLATTHTADPVITLTGAVTGSGTMTNLGSVSIATTATADPTLTINGDASGSATFTNLGNATLTLTVADDSHNHTIANVDGLQTALDGKSATSHNHTLDSLSNTTITSNTSGEILKWNGTAWVNNTLAEAGIQPAGSYLTTSTAFGGDVSGTYGAIVVANDSHTHAFNNLTGKTSGTGDYTTTGTMTAATFNATSTTNGGFQGIDADTATTPSFTWSSDLNTGIYRPAADTLSVTTAGAQRFTVGPAGQIGVGGANYGTSGQVLTSNGTGSAPSWQAAGQIYDSQTFTSSGTWTKPAGVDPNQWAIIYLWGGGGAGGSDSTTSGEASGGGGGCGLFFFRRVGDLGSTEAVVVGAGGVANGGDGGNSSFGGVTVYGGGGGTGNFGARGAGGSPFAKDDLDWQYDRIFSGGRGGGEGSGGSPNYLPETSLYGGGGGSKSGANQLGGLSRFGGNGGNGAASGTAPQAGAVRGGGGAGGYGVTGGNGGRGEVQVYILV